MSGIPLDEHAAMYVAASRRRHPPCVGLLRRFAERVDGETLAAHARDLAANPHGFGRRVVAARVPGARPRWEPASVLPPVRVETEPLAAAEIGELLDEELSMPPNPRCDPGWRMTALTDSDGGTIVLTWAHHAYGDGRAILETAFAPAIPEPAPAAAGGLAAERMQEFGDVMERLRRGVRGGARLGREAATVGWREPHSDLARLRPALAALRGRERRVGARSQRRVVALARVGAERWDAAAAERGGSGNTLLLAVLANLLRVARRSRGDVAERPLRLLLPFDTRARGAAAAGEAGRPVPASANAAGAAIVVLPGGLPRHDRLDAVRHATKLALRQAADAVGSATAVGPPGMVDAMQLLPSTISHRLAARVQGLADGVASNVGPIPEYVAQLGPHTADEVFLLAGPMLTDLTVCLCRHHSDVTLAVVADPARLGPTGGLREHVAEELNAWGVDPIL